MYQSHLPISALPIWSKLNDVSFFDIRVQDLGERGYGLAAERNLTSLEDTYDLPALLLVPQDLILSRDTIEEHGKADHHFRQLLNIAGGKTLRGDVLLFLLMQITINSGHGHNIGLSNPWTEYVRLLPSEVPLPTLWESERALLIGTSLEFALEAKSASLVREYEALRETTIDIPWCRRCWWDDEKLTIGDWLLVDAWFRSRCLEIPGLGESMVPCLDMVNHSAEPNSYYEPSSKGEVNLLLRPGAVLTEGDEVTISYGTSKSAAEMLFSYGFIDEKCITRSLSLSLSSMPGDPYGKAKLLAFKGAPILRLSLAKDGTVDWKSPLLYLLSLNEEDDLDFKVLQQTDGSRSHLRTLWQGVDVTDLTDTFETLTSDHPLVDVFKLRVVALLQERIQQQLHLLSVSEEGFKALAGDATIAPDKRHFALHLRMEEVTILEAGLTTIELQKSQLLENETVIRYLGLMAGEDAPEGTPNNDGDDDFS